MKRNALLVACATALISVPALASSGQSMTWDDHGFEVCNAGLQDTQEFNVGATPHVIDAQNAVYLDSDGSEGARVKDVVRGKAGSTPSVVGVYCLDVNEGATLTFTVDNGQRFVSVDNKRGKDFKAPLVKAN